MKVDVKVPAEYAQIILKAVEDMGYKIEYGHADAVIQKVVELDCNAYMANQPLIDVEMIQLALTPVLRADLVAQGMIADNDCKQPQHTHN